jgi:hypothetical protein
VGALLSMTLTALYLHRKLPDKSRYLFCAVSVIFISIILHYTNGLISLENHLYIMWFAQHKLIAFLYCCGIPILELSGCYTIPSRIGMSHAMESNAGSSSSNLPAASAGGSAQGSAGGTPSRGGLGISDLLNPPAGPSRDPAISNLLNPVATSNPPPIGYVGPGLSADIQSGAIARRPLGTIPSLRDG